jgi:uncharacterized membrane protein required for colicin V production
MSFLLDFIIIAIIAVTVYFAAKNGFVKTAISALSFVIAIAVTAMFASPLAEALKDAPFAETVDTAVTDMVKDSIFDEKGLEAFVNGESEGLNTVLSLAGVEKEEFIEWYSSADANGDDVLTRAAQYIAEPIIDIIAMLVAIIILFVGTQILLWIVSFFLNKLANLPILRTANKGLGILLGVVLALFRVFLFCFAMNLLIDNASFLNSDFLAGLNPENTFLFKMLSGIDVFSFFM